MAVGQQAAGEPAAGGRRNRQPGERRLARRDVALVHDVPQVGGGAGPGNRDGAVARVGGGGQAGGGGRRRVEGGRGGRCRHRRGAAAVGRRHRELVPVLMLQKIDGGDGGG